MSLIKQLTQIEERIQSIYMQRSAVVFGAIMKNNQGVEVNVTDGIDDGAGRYIEVDKGGVPQSNFTVQLNTIPMRTSNPYNLSSGFPSNKTAESRSVEIIVDTSLNEWSFICGESGSLKASYRNLTYSPRANWRVDDFRFNTADKVVSVSILVNGHDYCKFNCHE